MWLDLLTPEKTSGDNFGVGVQQAVKEKVQHLVLTAKTHLLNLGQHHHRRAKLLAKVGAYPSTFTV